MPEFLTLLPPDDARTLLLSHLSQPKIDSQSIAVTSSLGRFIASDIFAPHPLPDFPRTTVDGYAVHAGDTHGASDSLPAYLTLIGEVPMGDAPAFEIGPGQCALIHTGGMLPNGPAAFDSNGNGLIDTIYAGDLKGNSWKFDVSNSSTSDWNVALGGAPLFVSGTSKPIIAPPAITFHPKGGQLVLFGTGKYLETADTTNTDAQTMYGIWDYTTSGTIPDSSLVQQITSMITGANYRTSTQNEVNYSSTVKGWYMNLPISGERLTATPEIEDGLFRFTTIVPSASLVILEEEDFSIH